MPRDVPLREGDLRWLFHAVTHGVEEAYVTDLLETADELLHRAGQIHGAGSDATLQGIPLNRLYYQRLGPGPVYPITVLLAEGGLEPVTFDLVCRPRDPDNPDHGRLLHPGPPWHVAAWISIECDTEPACPTKHNVLSWAAPLAPTASAAARYVRDAAAWLLVFRV